jgi:hypothetical protein
VTRLLTGGSRVRGVEGIERGTGTRFRTTALLKTGADGRNSTIAKAVDAHLRRRGMASGAAHTGASSAAPALTAHMTALELGSAAMMTAVQMTHPPVRLHHDCPELFCRRDILELASLNELIPMGSGGNGARSPLLITTSRLPD